MGTALSCAEGSTCSQWAKTVHAGIRRYRSWMCCGSSRSAGSSSGLAGTKERGCRNDLPDQATSAATSTTSGSISVRCTGPLFLLNLFSEVSLISSGQGCPGCGGRSWRPSSRPARVERTVERPTIRICPSRGRPAMIAWGCVKGPMTAAQTTTRPPACMSTPVSSAGSSRWIQRRQAESRKWQPTRKNGSTKHETTSGLAKSVL